MADGKSRSLRSLIESEVIRRGAEVTGDLFVPLLQKESLSKGQRVEMGRSRSDYYMA